MPVFYRLLRNNKESGPFTLDELLCMTLQPYDLIWVEGQSAGWRYPSEIEKLQPHVDGQLIVKEAAINSIHPASFIDRSEQIRDVEQRQPEIANEEPQEELTAEMLEKKAN